MSQKILNRFEELIKEAKSIAQHKRNKTVQRAGISKSVDYFEEPINELYLTWKVKTENLLRVACGEDSVHYQTFLREKENGLYAPIKLQNSIPVILAAYDDLKGGFLISFKQIVQAEVFDSELEQAKSLLENGYKNAAAVIAGVVLETAIKELCTNNGIDIYLPDGKREKKLEKLNEELTKAGIYPLTQQKKITYYADIRNNAAHGKPENFDSDEVKDMIKGVEKFLID
ncbi:HEPN domain-containing protein [Acinetobacter baumannii]|nr:HEPN domain-containing protein [Acinetobacter baumannii]MDP7800224.1 HEPN domain-containing protein [Acinetobacter baumannii]